MANGQTTGTAISVEDSIKRPCSATVWHAVGSGSTYTPCRNKAVVTRDGNPYCGAHDPQKVIARKAKKRADIAAKRDADELRLEQATRLAGRLGGGKPAWSQASRQYTGGVTLTADEAEAVLRRLGA